MISNEKLIYCFRHIYIYILREREREREREAYGLVNELHYKSNNETNKCKTATTWEQSPITKRLYE
jgi:hypothetical protein